MTFCLGIKVREGLVGLADTRVTIGTEVITARKVYTHQKGRQSLFLMASGLRSVRDKALTYFEEALHAPDQSFDFTLGHKRTPGYWSHRQCGAQIVYNLISAQRWFKRF